jgi:hypothetical protein
MSGDEPIYADDNVIITKSIATIFETSYPIRAISSLSVLEHKKDDLADNIASGCMIAVFGFVGVALIIPGAIGILSNFSKSGGNPPPFGMVSAITIFLIGAVFIFLARGANRKRAAMAPPPSDFSLMIVTAAGERAAMRSKDDEYIAHVRTCIEKAIQLQ